MDDSGAEHIESRVDAAIDRLLAKKGKAPSRRVGSVEPRPNAGAAAERFEREAKQLSKTDGRRVAERRDRQINVKVTQRERDEFYALAKKRKLAGRELYLEMLATWKQVNGV